MEIIHLILGKANPERMNGVNKVVYQLATSQKEQGREVAIWGITRDLSRNFEERAFTTTLFPASGFPFSVHKSLRKAIEKKAGSNTVFHLHGGWIPVYSTLSRLFNRNNIRFVITGHGAYNTIAMQQSKWMKKIYFSLFEKQLLQRAAKVHSIGQSEVEGLDQIWPNKKNRLLPYGFQPQKSEIQREPNPEAFTIGFVGRLTTWTKGLDLLMDAFAEFQKVESRSKLWIVGDGPGKVDLEKIIEQKEISNVVLWGSKYGIEKEKLISQMHVFVHPSRNEGLPASLLEAASSGVPLIVSEQTNMAQSVREFEAGIALATNSVTELTNSFTELLNTGEKNMNRISDNARRMVSEAYNWEQIVDLFDSLYADTE